MARGRVRYIETETESETTHRGRMNSYYSWKNLDLPKSRNEEVRYRSRSSMCVV